MQSIVVLLLAVSAYTLAVPLPLRVRFPDERSDTDERAGRILLPPLEQPTREELIRSRANPIALTIPRELLPLAEPDQSLNAWQFYFPPGPPPPDDDFLDTAGSAALSATAASRLATADVPEKSESKDEEQSVTEATEVFHQAASETVDVPAVEEGQDVRQEEIKNSNKPSSKPTLPPDFNPQYEDGGWAPIAKPLSSL